MRYIIDYFNYNTLRSLKMLNKRIEKLCADSRKRSRAFVTFFYYQTVISLSLSTYIHYSALIRLLLAHYTIYLTIFN